MDQNETIRNLLKKGGYSANTLTPRISVMAGHVELGQVKMDILRANDPIKNLKKGGNNHVTY